MTTTPKSVIQFVIVALALIALALIGGAFTLIALNHPVPETVWTLAGTTVGALAMTLGSPRSLPEVPAGQTLTTGTTTLTGPPSLGGNPPA